MGPVRRFAAGPAWRSPLLALGFAIVAFLVSIALSVGYHDRSAANVVWGVVGLAIVWYAVLAVKEHRQHRTGPSEK